MIQLRTLRDRVRHPSQRIELALRKLTKQPIEGGPMEVSSQRTPDEIWAADRLGRKEEAELLLAYIESMSAQSLTREDAKSLIVAVDAGYGEGKSFFLRRFHEHLSLNHPVAFVDAWTDDLADEPLVALAATLKEALDPLIEKAPDLRAKWKDWLEKTGKVATIAGAGIAKRLLALAITNTAVAQLEELAAETGLEKDVLEEEAKGIGGRVIEGAEKALKAAVPSDFMREEIARFVAGRDAILQLKASLSALVKALDGHSKHPPIIIVVDELDRCRPTYAIKFLEEVKHLFDVPGVVFVLAMHTEQLAKAVAGVYGPAFEGDKYLRRFLTRRYRLKTPSLSELLPGLIEEAGLSEQQFEFLQVQYPQGGWGPMPFTDLLDYYLRAYGATPRDAYQVVDYLRTCASVVRGLKLIGPYLIPLVIAKVLNVPSLDVDEFKMLPAKFSFVWHPISGSMQSGSPSNVAARLNAAAKRTPKELHSAINAQSADFAPEMVYRMREASIGAKVPLADPARYDDLIEAVGRLENLAARAA